MNQIDRRELRALTSVVIRRVLVDHARKRHSRNSTHAQYSVHAQMCSEQIADIIVDLVTLDESLSELESIDPQKARIVELRFFGGLTMPKIAERTGKSLRSAERDWSFVRAWLCAKQIDHSTESEDLEQTKILSNRSSHSFMNSANWTLMHAALAWMRSQRQIRRKHGHCG